MGVPTFKGKSWETHRIWSTWAFSDEDLLQSFRRWVWEDSLHDKHFYSKSYAEDLLTLARMIGKKDTRHLASKQRSETLLASNLLLKRNLCHIRVLLTGCLPVCIVIWGGLRFRAFPRWQASTKKRERLTKSWESITILYSFSTSSASASRAKNRFKLPHFICHAYIL